MDKGGYMKMDVNFKRIDKTWKVNKSCEKISSNSNLDKDSYKFGNYCIKSDSNIIDKDKFEWLMYLKSKVDLYCIRRDEFRKLSNIYNDLCIETKRDFTGELNDIYYLIVGECFDGVRVNLNTKNKNYIVISVTFKNNSIRIRYKISDSEFDNLKKILRYVTNVRLWYCLIYYEDLDTLCECLGIMNIQVDRCYLSNPHFLKLLNKCREGLNMDEAKKL